MLLFEGEPLVFGLFALSVICLLVGGCTWGSRQDANDQIGTAVGITIFAIGIIATILFFMAYTYKKIAKTKEKIKLQQLQKELINNDQRENLGMVNQGIESDFPQINELKSNGNLQYRSSVQMETFKANL